MCTNAELLILPPPPLAAATAVEKKLDDVRPKTDAGVIVTQQFLKFVAVVSIASFDDAFHLTTVAVEWLIDARTACCMELHIEMCFLAYTRKRQTRHVQAIFMLNECDMTSTVYYNQ